MRDGRRVVGIRRVAYTVQAEETKSTEQTAADIFAKSQAISKEDPLETDEGKDDQRLFDHTDHVLAAYHAAVKKSDCRGHQHDQGG